MDLNVIPGEMADSLPTSRVAAVTDVSTTQGTARCPAGKVLVGIEFNEESPYVKKITRIKCATIAESRSTTGGTLRGSFVPVANGGVSGGTPRRMECPAGTVTESLYATQIGGINPNLVAAESTMLCRNLCTGALAGAGQSTPALSASSAPLHGSSIGLPGIPRIRAPSVPRIPSIQNMPRIPGLNLNSVPVLNQIPNVIDGAGGLLTGGTNVVLGVGTGVVNAVTDPVGTITNPMGAVAGVLGGGQQPEQPNYTFTQKRVGCPTGTVNANNEKMDASGNVQGITSVSFAHGSDGLTNLRFGCGTVRGQGGAALCRTGSSRPTRPGGGSSGGGDRGPRLPGGGGPGVGTAGANAGGSGTGGGSGTDAASTGAQKKEEEEKGMIIGASVVGALIFIAAIVLLILWATGVIGKKNPPQASS